MAHAEAYGPNLPTFADLKNHLRKEPLYFQVLEGYLRNTAKLIEDLRAKLDNETNEVPTADLRIRPSTPPSREQIETFHQSVEIQCDLEREAENEDQIALHLLEQQQQALEQEEEPVLALVDAHESCEEVEEMAEERQVSHDEEGYDAVPRTSAEIPERSEAEGICEIALRSRTIRIPQREAKPVVPEAFHAPAVQGLPARYQQLLCIEKLYVNDLNESSTNLFSECGICPKEFGTLKGWRIHASKVHKKNGFCQKCGHFVDMPHVRSDDEITAMMELHALEWCPRATKAVMNDRAIKRRRLELVGRNEEAEHYYIPSK
ncbi:Uncharacterized protein BM_BM9136, partial [Brugia malayi]